MRPAACAAGRFGNPAACGCTTPLPTRSVLLRTVLACYVPLIGSSSDKRAATLPNGASAAYRPVT